MNGKTLKFSLKSRATWYIWLDLKTFDCSKLEIQWPVFERIEFGERKFIIPHYRRRWQFILSSEYTEYWNINASFIRFFTEKTGFTVASIVASSFSRQTHKLLSANCGCFTLVSSFCLHVLLPTADFTDHQYSLALVTHRYNTARSHLF